MRDLAAVKATAATTFRHIIISRPPWVTAPHSAFSRPLTLITRDPRWASRCLVSNSAALGGCPRQMPHRRRNHFSYSCLCRCRSGRPSVTDPARPMTNAVTFLSSSVTTSTNITLSAGAGSRDFHTSTLRYSRRPTTNCTISVRRTTIRTTRITSAPSYARISRGIQQRRFNTAQLRQPVVMLESSLGSTRTVFDQLFRRRSSHFRECRSSSWLAKKVNSNAKRHSSIIASADSATTPKSTKQEHHEQTQPEVSTPAPEFNFRNQIPPQAWDSHMHVLDPRFQNTLAPTAKYTPSPTAPTRTSHMRTFEQDIAGLYGVVLVQPSIYGNDNSCLLDALHELGPTRARGVVGFEDPALWASSAASLSGNSGIELLPSPPSSSPSTPGSETRDDMAEIPSGSKMSHAVLQKWHEMGVRGVRINLQSHGDTSPLTPSALQALVRRYIDVVRPLGGWTVQLYVGMDMLHILEPIANGDLGDVKLCIDHMGHPHIARLQKYRETRDPYDIPGFDALVRLLTTEKVFVKISAAYRFSTETFAQENSKVLGETSALSKDVHPIVKELLKVAGMNSCVFATDWPHTRFDGLDIRPWMQSVVDLCGEVGGQAMVERVFRGNAENLWDIQRTKVE